jgi:peptidoglycan/LPS O-acetylase OafA/YrhL
MSRAGAASHGDPVAYRPGLDGLRALAVTAVILFHLGHLPGGNLGVDTFFVLSGWLITWKLLSEAERRSGRHPIDLRHFWAARARRLLPASLAVITAVAVVWTVAGIPVASLRRDVLFATFWSSNWGTITAGGDYWSHFGEPSPLTHFWSLAVEEQFYLVWPLVLVGVLLVARRRGRVGVGAVAVAAAAVSVVLMNRWFDPTDPTGTYLHTIARAHSLLIGAAAAAASATLPSGALRGGRTARRLAPMAALGALAIVAWSGERSQWLFRWGFPVFALLLAVVVVAAADSWAVRVLAAPPMRWLADRSYGLYLWHWPAIVLLSADRTGWDGPVLDVARVALALGLAHVSLAVLETPIRRRRRLIGWHAPATAGLALASVAIVAISVMPRPHTAGEATPITLAPAAPAAASSAPSAPSAAAEPATTVATTDDERIDGLAISADAAEGSGRPTLSPLASSADVAVAGPVPATGPVRVLVAGDSTAQHLSEALIPWATAHPDQLAVGSAAFPGCGLTAADDGRLHRFTDRDGSRQELDLSGCLNEWHSIPERVAGAEQFDVVLVSIGPWDAVDIHLPDGRVVSVADPAGLALVTDAYTRFVAEATAAGARVVWVTPPDTHLGWGSIDDPVNDPARWTALRRLIDELDVQQLDLPRWLADHDIEGPEGRPDGVHLTPEADQQFVAEVVGPTLADLFGTGPA